MKEKTANFIHLRLHSSYSLAYGAVKIDEIPDLCKKYNMPAVAITDSGNLFGALEFASYSAKSGIQPIMGCVINLSLDTEGVKSGEMVLLAKDKAGYGNLLKLVSDSFLKGTDHHHPVISIDNLARNSSGLIALTGGAKGIIGQYILNGNLAEAESFLVRLKDIFPGNLYIELMRHGLDEEKRSEQGFVDLAYKYDVPLVATNDVYFSEKTMFEAHDALICVAEGRFVAEENRPRFTPEHYFKSAHRMAELFSDIPEAIENSIVIAKRCSYMPEAAAPMLPNFPSENSRSETEELLYVSKKGLMERLEREVFKPEMDAAEKEAVAKPYIERLEFELDVITRMNFSGYFLIVSDFIRWSKKNGIPVGPGRGSGAGSVVAWALSITNLDPLRFGLLFERFLNPERISMPDFDIDFCQERRDEVINYVQQKYGADRVAQIITFGKLQARAVLRDVGRVLQIPYGQVDKICKMIPWNPIEPVTLSKAIDMDPKLRQEAKQDEQVAKLLDIGLKLEGLHRHASTHAAGVVIAGKPLTEIVPLYSDHRSQIATTQFSMKYAEMAGLVKFDFLGLKTLTVIASACKLLRDRGVEIDIDSIPLDDKKTFAMLSEGNAMGVFQMESSGMRDALRKMKPDCIEDIIALISLYRPGPMENIPTYIARKHGKEEPDYLHPKLEACLKETFGVIIYQEQVMQIARELSGYSLGSADLLRRAMGKKIKAEMDAQRDMFVSGAVKNGVEKSQASSIFDLVAKFAGYGFNKSHAAAYAVIGYQTAYLKANYPVEFLTACMNIDIGDTDKLLLFREEANSSEIKLLPPDINKSGAYFTVQDDAGTPTIRYALGALKNVGLEAMKELVEVRAKDGLFENVFDFARKCSGKIINKRQIESLAKSGVFDSLHKNRRQIFEAAGIITRYSQSEAEERAANQINLFGGDSVVAASVPSLPNLEDWEDKDRLAEEFDAIGFYLTSHPLDSYRDELSQIGVVFAGSLNEKIPPGGARIKIAGMVNKITHRSSNTGKRFSYLYISDPTGNMEVSLFNDALISESNEMIQSGKPLLIAIEARQDEGGVRLMAESITLLDKFLEERKIKAKLVLENSINLQELKSLLDRLDKGRAEISLIVSAKNGMKVEIVLPGLYLLKGGVRGVFSSLKGIKEVIAH